MPQEQVLIKPREDLTAWWHTEIAAIVADGSRNKGAMRQSLRDATTGVSADEANAYIDRLVLLWNEVGKTNNPTFANFRSEINSTGQAGEELFWSLIIDAVVQFPEIRPIMRGFRRKAKSDKTVLIPLQIQEIEDYKTANPGLSQVIVDALDAGIDKLNRRLERIQGLEV